MPSHLCGKREKYNNNGADDNDQPFSQRHEQHNDKRVEDPTEDTLTLTPAHTHTHICALEVTNDPKVALVFHSCSPAIPNCSAVRMSSMGHTGRLTDMSTEQMAGLVRYLSFSAFTSNICDSRKVFTDHLNGLLWLMLALLLLHTSCATKRTHYYQEQNRLEFEAFLSPNVYAKR